MILQDDILILTGRIFNTHRILVWHHVTFRLTPLANEFCLFRGVDLLSRMGLISIIIILINVTIHVPP